MNQPHVAGGQRRMRERLARILQERLEVPARDLQLIGGALVRVVAGAEHRDVAPRHHEQVAAVGQAAAGVIARRLCCVTTFMARDSRGGGAPCAVGGQVGEQRGRPRPGGVDDHRRRESRTASLVRRSSALTPMTRPFSCRNRFAWT